MNKKILSIFVMIMALSLFGVSCSNSDTTGTGGNNNQNKNFGTITPSGGTAEDSTLDITGIAADTTTGDKKVGLTLTLTPVVDGVSYKVTAVTRYTPTAPDSNQVNTGLDGNASAFTYDGTDLHIADGLDLKSGSGADSSWAASKTDYYKVTITVSKDGYNSKPVGVFVKIAY